MSIKDTIAGALPNLVQNKNSILALGAVKMLVDAFRPPKPIERNLDPFSLSSFTANIKNDGLRLTKGYYYVVYMLLPESDMFEPLGFHCNKVTLPGWRARTQEGKIYAIPYEIATSLEQDPVWLTFNIDIRHKIEKYFMDARKVSTFSPDSFSPEYKNAYQFQMLIFVTDESFALIHQYILNNAMIKTVQNIQYGSASEEFKEVTVEVVYESITVNDIDNSRKIAESNPDAVNKNMLKVGPFSADISLVNQAKDTITKIPSWFDKPIKI